ncbi:MAG TPA: hypothetical protein DCE41_34050 [Cytophagales bacterium]|nr:hypothetical protein [Cytophagales bacterium]
METKVSLIRKRILDREPHSEEGLGKVMVKYFSYLLWGASLLLSFPKGLYAQSQSGTVPLPTLFAQLETEMGLTFSFAPDLLFQFSIVPPASDLAREEYLLALQEATPFKYEVVDDKYVLVSPRPVDFTFQMEEEDTQLALPGGYVKQNGQYLPVTGDADGAIRFRVDWNPQDTLEFNFVGFEPQKLPILEALTTKNRTVAMELSTTVLAPVVVQSYLGAGISAFQQNQRLELRPDEMGVLPGDADKDLLVSLRNLPGIHTTTGLAGDLRIRGGTPDMTLILFNNIPIYHRGYYFGTISPFNTDMVDKVQVYRNGYGPELGGRVGGAIEISSEAKVPTQWQAGVSGNAVAASAYVKAPLIPEKLGLKVAGRASYPGNYSPLVEQEYNAMILSATPLQARAQSPSFEIDPFRFDYEDVNGTLTFTPRPGTTVNVDGLAIFNENVVPHRSLRSGQYTEDIDKIYNTGLNLSWDQHWGAWQGNSFLTYSDFQSHAFAGQRDLDDETLSLLYSGRVNAITSWRARSSWGRVLSDLQDQLTFGYEWNWNESTNLKYDSADATPRGSSDRLRKEKDERPPRPGMGDNPPPVSNDTEGRDEISSVHSLFAQYSHPSWNKLALDLGLRLSYFEQGEELRLEPRVFLNYTISDPWVVKGSVGSYSQYLGVDLNYTYNHLDENQFAWNTLAGGRMGRGLMTGTQAQVGFLWQSTSWLVDVEGYWKRAQGITATLSRVQGGGLELLDGMLRSRGVDMLVRTSQGPLDVWASYTLSLTENTFEELAIGWFPSLYDQRHLFNISGVVHWGNLRASLGWYLHGGVPDYSVDGPLPDAIEFSREVPIVPQAWTNVDRNPWTHQLDASVRYSFERGPLRTTLGVSVQNVYNQNNILNINRVFPSMDEDDFVYLPQTLIGFTPNFMLKVEYRK